MDLKQKRQIQIRNLLKEKALFSQEEICKEIQALGFEVTQPSISRDLTELGVVRQGGRYLPAEVLSEAQGGSEIAKLTTSIDTAGPNLIVLRTRSGSANTVAIEIDSLQSKAVVGTVAGDDTIFIAVKSKAQQTKLINDLKNILQSK